MVIENILSELPEPDYETALIFDYLDQVPEQILRPKYRLQDLFVERTRSHFDLWEKEYERHAENLSKLGNIKNLRLVERQFECTRTSYGKPAIICSILTILALVAGSLTVIELQLNPMDANVFGVPLAKLLVNLIVTLLSTIVGFTIGTIQRLRRNAEFCINCLYILSCAKTLLISRGSKEDY